MRLIPDLHGRTPWQINGQLYMKMCIEAALRERYGIAIYAQIFAEKKRQELAEKFMASTLYQLMISLHSEDSGSLTPPPPTGGNNHPNNGEIIIDPRTIGWNVSEDWGTDKNYVVDSTVAMNAAAKASSDERKPLLVWYGKYKISGPINLHNYGNEGSAFGLNPYCIVGQTFDGIGPEFVLDDNCPGYHDPANPKAVFDMRQFTGSTPNHAATNDGPVPSGIFEIPTGYTRIAGNEYYHNLIRDIRIKTYSNNGNSNQGAVGLCAPTAEESRFFNITIDATGGLACIYGINARDCSLVNAHLIGGRYAVVCWNNAGTTIVGCQFENQTEAIIYANQEFAPITVVGYRAVVPVGTSMMKTSGSGTAVGTMSFIDGVIYTSNDNLVWDNTADAKGLAIFNTYIRGSSNIVKSGNLDTVTQPGTWVHVDTYIHNNPDEFPAGVPPVPLKLKQFPSRSLIDGIVTAAREPATNISAFTGVVPTNLRTQHYWANGPYADLPVYYGQDNGTKVVTLAPYNAVSGEADSYDAFQQALDDAHAENVGVYVPPGSWRFREYLKLYDNSLFYSVWNRVCTMRPSDFRVAAAENSNASFYMVHADGEINGHTFMGFFDWVLPNAGGDASTPSPQEKFGIARWRVGRNSLWVCNAMRNGTFKTTPTPPNSHVILMLDRPESGGRFYGSMGHLAIFSVEGSNPNWHLIEISNTGDENTAQSVTFYACPGHTPFDHYYNMLRAINSSNIKMLGMSREEDSGLWRLHNVTNFWHNSYGRNRGAPTRPLIEITGASGRLRAAMLTCQLAQDTGYSFNPFIQENITGQRLVEIDWPTCVSYYQRGNLLLDKWTHDYM